MLDLLPRRVVRKLARSGPPAAGSQRRAKGGTFGQAGALEVRLAASAAEIRRAQALRYRIFYEDMAAIADADAFLSRRDADRFDDICDHLIVLDRSSPGRSLLRLRPEMVGAYRLLRQEVAARHIGFYSEAEYELIPLLRRKPQLRFLELGRSCVLASYRDGRTIDLLWRGIWRYALAHRVDVMIGCASLEGTDPDRLAVPLSFLHHHARAGIEWSVSARRDQRVEMDRLAPDAIDPAAAFRSLPPLLKGYLRLGAKVGEGAVIDRQFGTIDVFIILPVTAINRRYLDHYGDGARQQAA